MADSTLDHMRMKERVGGEFTIDEGAMTLGIAVDFDLRAVAPEIRHEGPPAR